MASADCTVLKVTMGHKLYSYLERKPQNYDVTFSVGPQKIVVKALKVILKSSSSVFEKEFEEKWENAVVKEGEGIPLPGIDADAFKVFVKLMIVDTWSVAALKELNLSAEQIFNLLSICRKYEMTIGVQSLEELSKEFFSNFGSYMESNEFLSLSQANLETILASDNISVTEADIFEGACRWAKKQCTVNRVDPTGANIRDTLGGCLYKIRFPTMNLVEFTKVIELQGLLTAEETVEIYRFIGASDKQSVNTDRLHFPTTNRVSANTTSAPKDCLILSLATKFAVDSNSSVDLDGKEQWIIFQPGKRIAVHALGFLGPTDSDASYKVSVRITRFNRPKETVVLGQVSKQILAAKNKKFHFLFDEPVTLDSLAINSSWADRYTFYYTLTAEGQKVAPQGLKTDGGTHQMQVGNNEFLILTGHQQLMEILFKNV